MIDSADSLVSLIALNLKKEHVEVPVKMMVHYNRLLKLSEDK